MIVLMIIIGLAIGSYFGYILALRDEALEWKEDVKL